MQVKPYNYSNSTITSSKSYIEAKDLAAALQIFEFRVSFFLKEFNNSYQIG